MKAENLTTSVDQKRPTLKRRTDTGTDTGTDPNDPGNNPKKDRPTLKRPGDPPPPDR